jgi:Polyketide cyclase / dehydrase and lipid transport
MRILKLVLASFFILFAIVTGIGLLFPSTVKVSRAVNISAPYDTVYKYLNDAKYWKLWMDGADSSTIVFLSAKTEGTGTVVKIGTGGEVTITRSAADSIFSNWKGGDASIQHSVFTLMKDATNNVTTTQWSFEQQLNWYPWERFGSMANDKILGPVMEQSLDKLKIILEKK